MLLLDELVCLAQKIDEGLHSSIATSAKTEWGAKPRAY